MSYIPSSDSVIGFQSQPSSLLVGASIVGLTPVAPTPSSVYVLNPVSTLSITTSNSSVTAFQGGAWSASITGGYVNVIGSVALGVGNSSVTQAGAWNVNVNSILGTYVEKNAVTPSAIGIVPLFKIDETNSVLSAISPQSPLPVRGSVAVLQGTNPWQVNMPSPSVLINNPSVVVNNIVTGQSSVYLIPGIGVLGSVAALQGTSPWLISGSVAVLEPGGIRQTSVMNTVPSSMLMGASVFGNLGAYQIGAWGASVMLTPGVNPIGSVTALQGTNPWLVNVPTPSYLSIQPGGSVLNANISGSIAARLLASSVSALQGTEPWVIQSIVGTFADDSAQTQADKGFQILGVRNDTLSSVTTADGDYTPFTVGPAGEIVAANSPITKWVVGTGSVMTGVSIQVLAAPGTSIFTYITGINVINEASVASRVTITQGRGAVPASMLTWLIAPAGGGSNNTYINPIRVLDNNGVSASINAVASIYVTITGFTAKL